MSRFRGTDGGRIWPKTGCRPPVECRTGLLFHQGSLIALHTASCRNFQDVDQDFAEEELKTLEGWARAFLVNAGFLQRYGQGRGTS